MSKDCPVCADEEEDQNDPLLVILGIVIGVVGVICFTISLNYYLYLERCIEHASNKDICFIN